MSPPRAISMPIVNVIPWTAVIRGFVNRRPRLNGSTGADVCASTTLGCGGTRLLSEEQWHLQPGGRVVAGEGEHADEQLADPRRGGSAHLSSSLVIFGVNAFFFSTRSTVSTRMCSSTTSVRTSPCGWRSLSPLIPSWNLSY